MFWHWEPARAAPPNASDAAAHSRTMRALQIQVSVVKLLPYFTHPISKVHLDLASQRGGCLPRTLYVSLGWNILLIGAVVLGNGVKHGERCFTCSRCAHVSPHSHCYLFSSLSPQRPLLRREIHPPPTSSATLFTEPNAVPS